MNRKLGFTLIELLIVVAIIAILAAIAVPNFLEAQTRSKVTRAKADMRACSVAIEAYRVDGSSYPYGYIEGFGGDPHALNWGFTPPELTTPIAYMTALPTDGFGLDYLIPGQNGAVTHTWWTSANVRTRFRYTNSHRWTGPPNQYTPKTDADWDLPYQLIMTTIHMPITTPWIMSSPGPDRTEDVLPLYNPNGAIYDPSNGTISSGDIVTLAGGGVK